MNQTTSLSLKEPLYIFFILLIETILLVTLIGSFDEGNLSHYASFIIYLKQGGIPPLSDYMLWSVVNITLGIPAFFVISDAVPGRSFTTRASLTLSIPILIFSILIIWGVLISIA